eukprot:735446_1
MGVNGIPKRMRGDYGTENYDCADELNRIRRSDRAFIFGRSVHNQRIERMWGDSNVGVSFVFDDLFNFMRSLHGLDANDALHIYCLHLVFMPRIQERLDEWVEIWNAHPIRTAGRRTPNEMFKDECDEDLDESDTFGIEHGTSWPAYGPKLIEPPSKLDIPDELMKEVIENVIEPSVFENDEDGIQIWLDVLAYLEDRVEVEYE